MYQKRDYETAIQLAAQGKLCLGPLITHRFPFQRYPEAYQTIEAAHGESMKVIIDL
jgi:L-iditol 2-dehydrogenase